MRLQHRGTPVNCSRGSKSRREHLEIGLGLFDHTREARPCLQAIEIGREIAVGVAERHHLVGVEQRRTRRAIGKAEGFSHRPGLRRDLLVDDAVA